MAIRFAFANIPAFLKNPTVRAGFTSCIVMGVGDALCQSILSSGALKSRDTQLKISTSDRLERSTGTMSSERTRASPAEDAPSGRRHESWDIHRTARFSLIGLTLHGPYFYTGFRALDTYFGPSKSVATALKKTFAGQFTMFPVYLACFLVYMGALERKTQRQIVQKVKDGFLPTFVGGCVFWPAANMINFMLVPPLGRIYYVNGAGLIWNAYLSWANAQLPTKHFQSIETVDMAKLE